MISISTTGYTYNFRFATYGFVRSGTERTLLLLGGERLEILDLGVGVDELLDLLDLEDPIRIGGDSCDDHRFVGRVRSLLGRYLVGKL